MASPLPGRVSSSRGGGSGGTCGCGWQVAGWEECCTSTACDVTQKKNNFLSFFSFLKLLFNSERLDSCLCWDTVACCKYLVGRGY